MEGQTKVQTRLMHQRQPLSLCVCVFGSKLLIAIQRKMER